MQFISTLFSFSVGKIVISLLGVVVIGINLYFVDDFVKSNLPDHWAVYLALAIFMLFYICFNLYLVSDLFFLILIVVLNINKFIYSYLFISVHKIYSHNVF